MNGTNYGSLWIQSVKSFERHLTPEEEVKQAVAVLGETPLRLPADADRARITDCIQIGTLFKLEAKTAAWHAFLRFDPTAPLVGDYEIHGPGQHRNEIGRVQSVTSIEGQDRFMQRYAMLAPFPTRYAILTKDAHGTLKVWLVGISTARRFKPEELEPDE